MKSLRTSRVVVIDDEPDEALPVVAALGKLGIGCVYLKGDRLEDLPEQPLTGIRVVVLDMRLGVTGTSHEVANATAGVFCRVVSPDQGPLIVLLWSKHPDDFAAFRDALFGAEPRFKPILLLGDLEKPGEMQPDTAVVILEKVKQLASQWSPISFLWNWEQLAHDAATGTTAMVAKNVSDSAPFAEGDDSEARRTKWIARLREILRVLTVAAAGKNAGPATATEDLLQTILALHLDRVEQAAARLDGDGELRKIFEAEARNLTAEQAARLNGMLLLSEASPLPSGCRPGDVFLPETYPAPDLIFLRSNLDVSQLKTEVLKNFSADASFRDFDAKAGSKKNVEPTLEQKEAASGRDKRKREIVDSSIPMLVEVTPSCDFAQRKRCTIRLLGGLLVPVKFRGVIDGKNDSLRALDALAVPGLNGEWIPVFSSRLVLSIPETEDLGLAKAAFRIRVPILNDLRHWSSSQSSRIGYLKFDVK